MKISFSEISFLYGIQSIIMNPYLDIKDYCKLTYKVKLNTLLIFVMLQNYLINERHFPLPLTASINVNKTKNININKTLTETLTLTKVYFFSCKITNLGSSKLI